MLASPGRRRFGSSDAELVAAEPGDGVALAERLLQPVGDLLQQAVAGVVAERVVDLLEVVEVDQHHGGGGVRAVAGGDRLLDAVAEQRAVGQPGQRVVQRLVLLGDRRAAAAVDGEERQQQQQQRGQAELRGEHDDRREAEQQARGRGLEEQVVGEVAAELDDALGERDDGRDQRAVDDEEDGRDAEDRDQVHRPERQRTLARDVREEDEDERRRADRHGVLRGVEGDLLDRLAVDRVGDDAGADQAGERDGGAAGEHQREREAGRGRDLALGSARVDLERDELADERAQREEGELRLQQPVEGVDARAEHERCARETEGDDQRDVEVEWMASCRLHWARCCVRRAVDRGCPAPTTAAPV